ncbi:MAG: DUF2974 domain-containing protein [Clostridia bacterium]|nr:DUF2974 domain-containing protein [Clostridia bacterium]
MSNLLDYIDWRGDLSFEADRWNEIDALVMATVCYNNFPDAALPGARWSVRELAAMEPAAQADSQRAADRVALLSRMARSNRFGGLLLRDFVNEVDMARNIQFSAVTADCPDGSVFVAFRGTDSTLVGWKEDFMMTFETPVPAQTAAAGYLQRVAGAATGPVRVAGHSKGGNLAVYAAMNADEAAQARLEAIYSFDGPGLDEASIRSAGYARVKDRIRSFVPQASIVGLLLAYHPDYTVVKSSAVGGIGQHDTITWQVQGPRFLEAEQVNRGSEAIDQALHEWLRQCSPDQRRVFVNTLFDILESTNATQLSDMRRNLRASATSILEATRRVDPATGRMIWDLLGRFVQIGAGSLLELLGRKPEGGGPGQN